LRRTKPMNEIRAFVEQVKKFYSRGIYKKAQIDNMLRAGKITQEEYYYILSVN